MAKFADQLFTDLMAEYRPALDETELPEPHARRRVAKPVWFSGGFVTIAALVTTVLLVFTTGAPAYAITQNSDGTVTLTLNQLKALAQATAALHSMGRSAAAGCQLNSSAIFSPSSTDSVTIDPKKITSGIEGMLVAATGKDGSPRLGWILVPSSVHNCADLNAALDALWGAMVGDPLPKIENGKMFPVQMPAIHLAPQPTSGGR